MKSSKTVKARRCASFFVGAGEKTLSLKYVTPEKVPAEQASHPILDNLIASKSGNAVKYQNLAASKAYFLERFPQGFSDEAYLETERNYKVAAHERALQLLSKKEFDSLLETQGYDEICRRCLRVMNATNLVFPNEKMALKDGLAKEDGAKQFAISLYNCLWNSEKLENDFAKFIRVLEEIEADKWTTASYFLYTFQPDKYMFIKPTITKHAAELSRFAINYRPQLNWVTYKSVLDFSDYLRAELADLEPRDMIDVQSFMWCVSPRD